MIHKWEEPVISGKNGSGAIFFSGCNLRCCFCQNGAISGKVYGKPVSQAELVREVEKLLSLGADNINLVSPTPYAHLLPSLLKEIKTITAKPIIYNSGGYDDKEWLSRLEGLVDVYLPDFKYLSSDLAEKYSSASDYPSVAVSAIAEMLRQQSEVVVSNGLIQKGVIIRHLVLPGHKDESVKIMQYVAEHFKGSLISLMRQYTPEFNRSEYKNLARKVTSYEYDFVLDAAIKLGLDGFVQDKESASSLFTPSFKRNA